MIDKSRAVTAGVTLLAAVAVGHFMQSGGAVAGRTNSDIAVAGVGTPVQFTQAPLVAFLPKPPSDAIMPIEFKSPDLGGTSRVAALNVTLDTDLQSDVETPLFLDEACDLTLTALPEPGALVRLNLGASCYQNQRILVSHAGLEFADVTGSDGSFSVEIPAMNQYAPFSISFADGRSVEAKTLNLTLDGYERVAVNWSGAATLNIHAMEFGAKFGGPGHVWAGAARNPQIGVNAEGGFLTQLGNPDVLNPVLAEVYSFPFDRMAKDGAVILMVEAEITPQTCGTEIRGNSLQLSGNGELSSTEVALTMPQCGGENGYLVLNNLFQDLKIARN